MNLYEASNQWANRPADQRFRNLAEMTEACRRHADSAVESEVSLPSLSVEPTPRGIYLVGQNSEAELTHWAFGQLCSTLGAPAGYLRSLPTHLAASNLAHHVATADTKPRNLLLHRNGHMVCRSVLSEQYARIWNYQICDRLQHLPGRWVAPLARPRWPEQESWDATQEDIATMGGRSFLTVGEKVAASGRYASDHDMFAFLISPDSFIDDGSPDGLCRGIMVKNSEVGASALTITRFLFRAVCGNHIIWDASEVEEIRLVHRGDADVLGAKAWRQVSQAATKYLSEGGSTIEAAIKRAKVTILPGNSDAERISTAATVTGLSRMQIQAGIDAVVDAVDGDPLSQWGIAQGLTRVSQGIHADSRTAIDKAAGKLLKVQF
jgi:hypothetical protein